MGQSNNLVAFFREFRTTFATTGAVLPSSRYLAREICRPIGNSSEPATYLEAGPGTGAFTHELLARLGPKDRLVMVELNDRFVDILKHRLRSDESWRSKRDQVELRHGSVLDVPVGERFDGVVCGLPFNNFEPELVERFFSLFMDRLKPEGVFSFFEYYAIRRFKSLVAGTKERDRLRRIGEIIEGYRSKGVSSRATVFRNAPPAVVHHLQRNGQDGAEGRPGRGNLKETKS